MNCGSCKHLGVTSDKDGKVRVRKGSAYPCNVKVPEAPLPTCMTVHRSYVWPPWRSWVTPDMGTDCPLHEERS